MWKDWQWIGHTWRRPVNSVMRNFFPQNTQCKPSKRPRNTQRRGLDEYNEVMMEAARDCNRWEGLAWVG